MQPLLKLSSFAHFKEQLALELHKAQRSDKDEFIAIIADTLQ
jgi:hypothetical protein